MTREEGNRKGGVKISFQPTCIIIQTQAEELHMGVMGCSKYYRSITLHKTNEHSTFHKHFYPPEIQHANLYLMAGTNDPIGHS